jgi:hypothetical protein
MASVRPVEGETAKASTIDQRASNGSPDNGAEWPAVYVARGGENENESTQKESKPRIR